MLKEAMEALLGIADWYASPSDTFIQKFSSMKPLHVLPKFAFDILVMQEVAHHISVGLIARLLQKNNAPWPTLLLWIGLYEIQSIKQVHVEEKQMKNYPYDLRSFNPYDSHCIVNDHSMRVQFNWIHGAFHWVKEVSWRQCYNSSGPNE